MDIRKKSAKAGGALALPNGVQKIAEQMMMPKDQTIANVVLQNGAKQAAAMQNMKQKGAPMGMNIKKK